MNIIKKLLATTLFLALQIQFNAQGNIIGKLQDSKESIIPFANIALYKSSDSTIIKVEATKTDGSFLLSNIKNGNYFLKITFIGFKDLIKKNIVLKNSKNINLGTLIFHASEVSLREHTITAERVMVEIKPDRTIFNVQGTINSTGENAINLLRKAPSVMVDNNDNISVLGRSGVRVFIDGKVLPLSGDDLSNYLKNLSADQIDRFEIITSPGAKYEAQGNAGIIDIKLKKDKTIGANGTLGGNFTKGDLTRFGINTSGNYRTKKMNLFGALSLNRNDNYHNINFQNYQNNIYLNSINNSQNNRDVYQTRFGADFYVAKNHTVGFLATGGIIDGEEIGYNRTEISNQSSVEVIDSLLIANNTGEYKKHQNTINFNYQFNQKNKQNLTFDLDYGQYKNITERTQPNDYFDANQDSIISNKLDKYNTPNDIYIYTAKLDYEKYIGKGKLGLGTKYSAVETKNTFEVYNVLSNVETFNNTLSNLFDYSEKVLAGYISYGRPLGKKWNFVAGLRAENTNSEGKLTAFLPSLQVPSTKKSYLNFFPNLAINWKIKPIHNLNLSYGRRINRPDYNVLNPFRTQTSEISVSKGNPNLKPEIVNNLELGYTFAYRYNFKLGFSRTDDKITRLIGPDNSDPRARFISWDNLATKSIISLSASVPFQIKKWWNVFLNASSSYVDNQADYGVNGKVDVQVFSYMFFQQSTFTLPKGYKAEVSGYFSGPGVWGGVFKYDENWSVNVGIQKLFLKDALKVKLSANNIFNRVGWKGSSEFNGLKSIGNGRWDARFISVSVNYNFGNQNLKSRKRKTGIDKESKRVK